MSLEKAVSYGHHLSYSLATLMAIGGLAGYVRKRSIVSLFAGTIVGSAYLYSGYLARMGEYNTGNQLALLTSTLLTMSMLNRYAKTHKTLPLTLSAIGIGATAFYTVSLYQINKSS